MVHRPTQRELTREKMASLVKEVNEFFSCDGDHYDENVVDYLQRHHPELTPRLRAKVLEASRKDPQRYLVVENLLEYMEVGGDSTEKMNRYLERSYPHLNGGARSLIVRTAWRRWEEMGRGVCDLKTDQNRPTKSLYTKTNFLKLLYLVPLYLYIAYVFLPVIFGGLVHVVQYGLTGEQMGMFFGLIYAGFLIWKSPEERECSIYLRWLYIYPTEE